MRVNSIMPTPRIQTGFTLIEVMIVVVIVAILAAIAVPAYNNYVLQGKLIEATNNLSAIQAQMELYYQDNRQYTDVSTTIVSPCDTASLPTLKNFTLSCPTLTTSAYTITATGSTTATTGFSYSVDNTNAQSSVVGSVWGGATYACWISRPSLSC